MHNFAEPNLLRKYENNMKRLLRFWAYVSCHVTCAQTDHELETLAGKRVLFILLKMGNLR